MTVETSVGVTPVQIFKHIDSREWAIIKNAGPDTVYIEIGDDSYGVTPARGVAIPEGESFFLTTRDMSHVARMRMHAISDGSSAVTTMENP